MKTNLKTYTLLIIISFLFIQNSFAQSIFKYDNKYYDGYILTKENPATKKVTPNQKIECKIKNKKYFYYPGADRSGVFYVEYMTSDGKKDKIWWADIAEIKTDSFYYKLFNNLQYPSKGYYDLISRRVLEGRINYWFNSNDGNDLFEINDSIVTLPFGDGGFMVTWNFSKNKVEIEIKKYKEFMVKLVNDDTELVAKINNDTYLDFSNYDGAVYRNTLKIVKEYNAWYTENHK